MTVEHIVWDWNGTLLADNHGRGGQRATEVFMSEVSGAGGTSR